MIRYHGRMLHCFMERKGCEKKADFRVEGDYLLMHVCAEHRTEAESICNSDPAKSVELQSLDGEDVLGATTWGNAELRQLPHIIEVTDEP